MKRVTPALLVLVILGCASTPCSPALEASAPPPQAFALEPRDLQEAAEVWRAKLDVQDYLAEGLQDYPAPKLVPDGKTSTSSSTLLLDTLKEIVAPGTWDTAALAMEGGQIVARHAPLALTRLQSALRTLKENRARMVRTGVRFHLTRPEAVARFGNLAPVEGGLGGTFERRALEEALGSAAPARAPSMTSFHGQKSHVMFLSRKAYFAAYDPEPTVGITTEGIAVEIRVLSNGERRNEFLFTLHAQAAGPPEFVALSTPRGIAQLPRQASSRAGGLFSLRSDQAFLLLMPNPAGPGAGDPLLAVTVTLDWLDSW